MRIVYTLNSFITDFFDSIDDFLGKFPTLYSLIDSQSDRRVYKNLEYNLDMIFYSYSSSTVVLIVTPEYNNTKGVWEQLNILCSGYAKETSDIGSDKRSEWETKNVAYYFPAPTISFGDRLVANYNPENHTFMFSVIRDVPFNYSVGTHVAHRTYNMFFGNASKYLNFEGGFFYGSDNVHTFEKFYREKSETSKKTWITTKTYRGEGIYEIFDSSFKNIKFHINDEGDWVNDPYNSMGCCFKGSMSNPDNINNFEVIMRVDIDNSPNRGKDELVSNTAATDFTTHRIPDVRRSNIWAVTMDIEYYTRLVCSINARDVNLPTYKPLLCESSIHEGHITNTLNNISLIMPLWFMVQRDPSVLDNYSAIGYNNVINFINMFNMDTDRITNGTYPIADSTEYNCFQMGSRRAMFGMKGYSGLAFKLEGSDDGSEPEPEPPSPENLDLLDIDEMENHMKPNARPILNITVGNEKGYGGDTHFIDMSDGSLILKHPYTNYSSIVFRFCNDSGTVVDTVTWSKANLDAALNGSNDFNLLPPNSPVDWLGDPGEWSIKPFSSGSTSTMFLCSYQNCGLIGLTGNV